MGARVTEIAPDVFEISVHDAAISPPMGLTFNQFLIRAEEPLLYHTGMKRIFPILASAVNSLINIADLRWIMFAHVEGDECGALRNFLDAAPTARVAHGALGTSSIADMCGVRPDIRRDGERLELGGRVIERRVRHIDTPHVPHNWESRVSTRTWRRRRVNSSRSAVLNPLRVPPSMSARCTHSRTAVSVRSRSRLIAAMPFPDERTKATTSGLYSSVNFRRSRRAIWTSSAGLFPTSWWSVLSGQAQSA